MSRFIIDEHGWTRGPGVVIIESNLCYPQLDSGNPIGVMWHYTGGAANQGSSLTLARSISREGVAEMRNRGTNPRKASWHIIITKEGNLIQSISFKSGAWHCAEGLVKGFRTNKCLIGIELENSGWLRKKDDNFYRWSSGWAKLGHAGYVIPRERVASAGSKYWDDFPKAQVEASRELILALRERYGMSVADLRYEHRAFDPKRREDPGDLWVDQYLPVVLAGLRDVTV